MNTINPTQHLGLVHHTARKFLAWCKGALEYEDLIQAGSIGLLKAADKFDESRGIAFSTYASYWVWQSILREAQNHGRNIRIPCNMHERYRRDGIPLPPPTLSLDAPLTHADGEDRTILDTIGVDDDPVEAIHQSEIAENVQALLNTLSPRLRFVVQERFGRHEATLSEVAEKLGGRTRERARQCEAKALKNLARADRRMGGAGQALATEVG